MGRYHKIGFDKHYENELHFIFTVHLFITELFVPTNALRQFFHCFLYYMDAPIRISAVILPSSGGILSEFLHRPILWVTHCYDETQRIGLCKN
jgi:hypothetical protein